MTERECQAPLIDLLRSVPEDARMIYEHSPTHSQSIPVGRLCKEAAAAIASRDAELVRITADRDAKTKRMWELGHECDALHKEIDQLREALKNPPQHRYWGAGEPDCPKDIKGGNGELHTLRCKVCGVTSPRNEICLAAIDAQGKT